MKVILKKSNNIIADKIKKANNPITRVIGLLNKSSLNQGEGLLITPCNGVHSFFMRFNFDAVYLNQENKIVFLKKDIAPYKVMPIIKEAKQVLELKANTISEFNIELNDELEFIE